MRRETDEREPAEAVLRWWESYGAFGARFAREWHRVMPTLRRHPTLVTTAVRWGLYVGFDRNPVALIGPMLLAALALWPSVAHVRRRRPDPDDVLRGFARGLLIVTLFGVCLAGLLFGICFVALG